MIARDIALIRCLLGALSVLLAGSAFAVAAMPPHLNAAGQDAYRQFLEAANHSAFAVAPGGAWGWSSGEPSRALAADKALATCQDQTAQRCVLYAADDKVVFDAAAWPHLWGPYASAAQAKRAKVGKERGQRLPDLAFKDAKGVPVSLAALKGKVVVLHLWGAWCAPCRREMPELQKLRKTLADKPEIAFVVMQAREKFAVSQQWAQRQGIDMALVDSGSTGEDDTQFRLAGGRPIKDRDIAASFPTTYVLDRHGLVVFSHVGSVDDWRQYEAFLLDVMTGSAH